jgi:tellurite resistance protein TehA-like permease
MSDSILYGLVGLMFFQAYVTVRVVRHKSYTPEKKRSQLLIIWLVPFVGAAMALSSLETEK